MAISDDFRARIRAVYEQLQHDGQPHGARGVINYLRFERPGPLTTEDEEGLWDAGWRSVVGSTLRAVATAGGSRTILSVAGEDGRNYKQLQLIDYAGACSLLHDWAMRGRSARIEERGWWQIAERLRAMPIGSTVADIFPSEERWDQFWGGIKASDLFSEAA